ncbi:MAG: hypothetical protein JXA90_15590 [Planctomycetes bacterium]|nr:hypothetical protein [Planctomycetota bacterium]
MMRPAETFAALCLAVAVLAGSGCGYVQNVADDFRDIWIFGAGITVPVSGDQDGEKARGIVAPSFGIYVEATEAFALGCIKKDSLDVEWDRRGMSVTADRRAKIGLPLYRKIWIEQQPIAANRYKREGNELDGWRQHMEQLTDPVYHVGAKKLIYRDYSTEQGPLHRGWQDWEIFSVEVALVEPFFLHSGVNLRVGFDLSEVFDFALSLFGLDLYGDAAYDIEGNLLHKATVPQAD